MRGLELNGNLLAAGATFARETRTAPVYRLWSIGDRHPAMVRVAAASVAVAVEVWSVPAAGLADILLKELPTAARCSALTPDLLARDLRDLTAIRMADDDHGLTDADRRAIADIRRELDAEFGALEEAAPLTADEIPKRRARRSVRRVPSIRPLVLAAFGLGVLTGALAGGTAVFVWLHSARDDSSRTMRLGPPPPATEHRADDAAPPEPAAAEVNGVTPRAALDAWLEATRRGDIAAQMRFYPSRVPVYYTWRDVPREAVFAEKRKVFGAATRLSITTGTPMVDVTGDGAAVARFRKRYVIEGPAINRKGEVLQELRWERTDTGWVIVSERDAQVLAAD